MVIIDGIEKNPKVKAIQYYFMLHGVKKNIIRLSCFIWQRSGKYIYLAKEIIFYCYYNRNKTETILADQLKQASGHRAARLMYGNDCVATVLLGLHRDPTIHNQWCSFSLDPMISKLKNRI